MGPGKMENTEEALEFINPPRCGAASQGCGAESTAEFKKGRGLRPGWFGSIFGWLGIVWDDSGTVWFGMHVRDCLGLFRTVLGQFGCLFWTVWESLDTCLGLFG